MPLTPWDSALVRQSVGVPPTAAQLAALRAETDIYRRVLAAGGLVALGTDQPLVPVGLSLHLGLRALHRGGFSPAAALRTVTVLPARLFGVERDLGTVRPGRLADLTVVDGDPFTDFDSLVRTVSVLRGGTPYETEDLVAAYEPAAPSTATQDDWAAAGRLMRRDGCCAGTGVATIRPETLPHRAVRPSNHRAVSPSNPGRSAAQCPGPAGWRRCSSRRRGPSSGARSPCGRR